jgi:hypothetical protein
MIQKIEFIFELKHFHEYILHNVYIYMNLFQINNGQKSKLTVHFWIKNRSVFEQSNFDTLK